MRIALGQINTTVGDLSGNAARMLDFARRAAGLKADIIVFPELSLTGYPPRDLLEKQSFLERTECALQRLATDTAQLGLTLICGTVSPVKEVEGNRLHNSAAVLRDGKIVFRQHKMLLPTSTFSTRRAISGRPIVKSRSISMATKRRSPFVKTRGTINSIGSAGSTAATQSRRWCRLARKFC